MISYPLPQNLKVDIRSFGPFSKPHLEVKLSSVFSAMQAFSCRSWNLFFFSFFPFFGRTRRNCIVCRAGDTTVQHIAYLCLFIIASPRTGSSRIPRLSFFYTASSRWRLACFHSAFCCASPPGRWYAVRVIVLGVSFML